VYAKKVDFYSLCLEPATAYRPFNLSTRPRHHRRQELLHLLLLPLFLQQRQ
jgi:hypothetical protein